MKKHRDVKRQKTKLYMHSGSQPKNKNAYIEFIVKDVKSTDLLPLKTKLTQNPQDTLTPKPKKNIFNKYNL
jgi:hypothetical protein